VLDGSDNCYRAWNPAQENCNKDAEDARRAGGVRDAYGDVQGALGDACDPVPCPLAEIPKQRTVAASCAGTPSVGTFCVGREIHDVIHETPLGSHIRFSNAMTPADRGLVVAGVATHARFCQAEGASPTSCHAASVIQEDRLQLDRTAETERRRDRAYPYHRITLGTSFFGRMLWEARGKTHNLDYGRTAIDRRWNFNADEAFWANAAGGPMVTPPGASDDCMKTATYGAGSCLNGTLWLHGDTPVGGDFLNDMIGDVRLGANGGELSNFYVDVAPDRPTIWGQAGVGFLLDAPFFIFRTLPDPAPEIRIEKWMREHPIAIGIDQKTGKANAVDEAGRAFDVSGFVSSARITRLKSGADRFLSPVEASAYAGSSRDIAAVLLSRDGTMAPDVVTMDGGRARLGSETFGRGSSLRLAVAGPNARSGFTALFSRAANGIFVVGGQASGAPAGDAWFQPIGGAWRKIDLRGYALSNVEGATYSFRDGYLWILETVPTKGIFSEGRLLRVSTNGAGVDVISSWPVLGLFDKRWLTLDASGDLLLSASSTKLNGFLLAHVRVDGGNVSASMTAILPGTLGAEPIVDMSTISLLGRDALGTPTMTRLPTLPATTVGLDALGGLF
jgi:hypothetical protein